MTKIYNSEVGSAELTQKAESLILAVGQMVDSLHREFLTSEMTKAMTQSLSAGGRVGLEMTFDDRKGPALISVVAIDPMGSRQAMLAVAVTPDLKQQTPAAN